MSDEVKKLVTAAQNTLTEAQATLDNAQATAAQAQQAVDRAKDALAIWTKLDTDVDAEEAAKASGVQTYGTPEPAPADDTPQEAPPVEQAQ